MRELGGRAGRWGHEGGDHGSRTPLLRPSSLRSTWRLQPILLCLLHNALHMPHATSPPASGLDFDVGIGGSQALFKSTMLGLLAQVRQAAGLCWPPSVAASRWQQAGCDGPQACPLDSLFKPDPPHLRPPALHPPTPFLQYEWRFGALVRLVKLWARHHDVNDSTNGSLNSFALTLLVVFHLQTRHPAVLPPLCQLCGGAPGDPRPMQEGRFPDWHLLSVRSSGWCAGACDVPIHAPLCPLHPQPPPPIRPPPTSPQVACDRLSAVSRSGGPGPSGGNSETLLELLASFFALYQGLLDGGWAEPKGADASALRGWVHGLGVAGRWGSVS